MVQVKFWEIFTRVGPHIFGAPGAAAHGRHGGQKEGGGGKEIKFISVSAALCCL